VAEDNIELMCQEVDRWIGAGASVEIVNKGS